MFHKSSIAIPLLLQLLLPACAEKTKYTYVDALREQERMLTLEIPAEPVKPLEPPHRKHEQVVYIPDTTGITFESKRILSVTGDFDGDGNEDVLSEHFFNERTNGKIRKVPIDFGHLGWLYTQYSVTWLVCDSNSIPPLKVDERSWGLLTLLNLRDINEDGIDEVAIVRDNADYSSLTSCWIYQYCNGTWRTIYTFGVHESTYWYDDGFDVSVYYEGIPRFLENRMGTWYYYDYYDSESQKFHDEDWNQIMIPLAPDIPSKYHCD